MTRMLQDRSTWFRVAPGVLLVVLATLLIPAPDGGALAAEVTLSLGRPADNDLEGAAIAVIGDINYDGIPDLLAAGQREPATSEEAEPPDRLRLYPGTASTPFRFGAGINMLLVASQNAGIFRDVELVDLDRDGRLDYLAAGLLRAAGTTDLDSIGYYRNAGIPPNRTLPLPDFSRPFNQLFGFAVYQALAAVELDGDNYPDVVAVGDDFAMAWFQTVVTLNPQGQTGRVDFIEQTIATTGKGGPRDIDGGEDGASDVVAGDVDGDGDLDLVAVFWENDTVAWYENDGEAVPGFVERLLDQDPDFFDPNGDGPLQGFADGPVDVAALDMDDDTDLDLVVLSRNDDRLTIYRNNGLTPPSFERQTVTSDPDGAAGPLQGLLDRPTTLVTGDLDGDGDADVVAGGETLDQMVYFDNSGASPPSFTVRTLAQDPDGPRQVGTSVFNAVPETVQGVPPRTETVQAVVAGEREGLVDGIASLALADVDGDGDADLASAARFGRRVSWHENLACGTGFPIQPIDEYDPTGLEGPNGATAVFPADLDGDGDIDVAAASAEDDSIRWYENDGELIPGFTPILVSENVDGANDVVAVDVDGDGHLDLVTASPFDGIVRWFRNDGNTDPEFTENVVGAPAPGLRGVAAADLDGDGDVDVVSAHTAENVVAWWENTGGSPLMFTRHNLTREAYGAWDVDARDVSGDGLADIVSTSFATGQVLFFVNLGTDPLEFLQLEITTVGDSVLGAIGSGASGMDLAGATGPGGFGEVLAVGAGTPGNDGIVEPLAAGVSQAAIDVGLGDLNGDALVDLVIVSAHDDKVAWYRNSGDIQVRPLEQVITEDPDGNTVRSYEDTGEAAGTAGACAQREVWRCRTVPPLPNQHPLQCGGPCSLPQTGTCQFAPLKTCRFESCVGGFCATSGAACSAASDCASAQCGDDGPCRFSGTCSISRLNLQLQTPPPEPEPALPPDLCETELCIGGQCESSGLACTTNLDCEAAQCNFGACEAFTVYTESISQVQEGVDHGPSAVAVADLDQDGDQDFVVSSVLGNTISWWENNGLPDAVFSRRPVSGAQDGPRSLAIADLNGDGAPDIVSGSYRDGNISWYLNATGDSCVLFDVNGDGRIDSTELSWMGRAFGSIAAGGEDWWTGIDLSEDGRVDGLDLSILGSSGVWGETVFSCSHTCAQE